MGRTTGLRSGRRPGGNSMAEPPPSIASPSHNRAPEPPPVEETIMPESAAAATATATTTASSLEPGRLAARRNPPPIATSARPGEPMVRLASPPQRTVSAGPNDTREAGAAPAGDIQPSVAVATSFMVAAQADSSSKEGIRRSAANTSSTPAFSTQQLPPQNETTYDLRPGAYTDTGMSLIRATSFRKNQFHLSDPTPTTASAAANNPQQWENEIYQDEEEGNAQLQPQSQMNHSVNNETSTRSMVVAKEVPEGEEDQNENRGSSMRFPTATGVDTETLQQRKDEEQKRTMQYARGCGLFVVVAILIIVVVVVAIKATPTESDSTTSNNDVVSPTASPTTLPMPPMENYMDILYYSLPRKTRESLSYTDTPQRAAWEWLLNHPNITTYAEWRKKQIFAMATLFYSFEGPRWTGVTTGYGRWMNYAMEDECAWVLSEEETGFLHEQTLSIFGRGSYTYNDFYPCNEDGELQTILILRLFLPTDIRVSIPPEIELLPSLKIFGIAFSQTNAKLSDLFAVPELVNLPNLEGINLYSSGVSGSIPLQVCNMTNLRHIVLGGLNNLLENTIPTEITRMSSLEYFHLYDVIKGTIGGKLPSELGLMTNLTGLEVSWSAFSGTIPTELGSLTRMRRLAIGRNQLSGTIPTEIVLMTDLEDLFLGEEWEDDTYHHNTLIGSLPSQLWKLSHMRKLRLASLPSVLGRIPQQLAMPDLTEFRLGGSTQLSGTIPSQFWKLSHMEDIFLSNLPNLHGRIPAETVMSNLTRLILSGSPHLSGTISEALCNVKDLKFDCSNLLCGCDCPCNDTIDQTSDINHQSLP